MSEANGDRLARTERGTFASGGVRASGWNHKPTRSVRLPECFYDQIRRFAIALDTNDLEALIDAIPEQWLFQVKEAIAVRLSERTVIEEAIVYLADQCDGATHDDDVGFNKPDATFGRWAAIHIRAGNRNEFAPYAQMALNRLQKYAHTQLVHLDLPQWEQIQHLYGEQQDTPPSYGDSDPSVMTMAGEVVIVQCPYSVEEVERLRAIFPPPERFDRDIKAWIFSYKSIPALLEMAGNRYEIDPQIIRMALDLEPVARKAPYRIELIEKAQEIAIFHHPFDPDEVKKIKAIGTQGRRFVSSDKSWRFRLNHIDGVINFANQQERYEVDAQILQLFEERQALQRQEQEEKEALAFKKATTLQALVDLAQLDRILENGWTLRNYQKEGVEWLLSHWRDVLGLGGIFEFDMGLGKTLCGLVAAKALRDYLDTNPTIIVIATTSTFDSWLRHADIVQVPIEIYSWDKQPEPLEQDYILIVDEAQLAQTLKARRTQNMLKLAIGDRCVAQWLLTGTSSKHGRPINLLPLLKAVHHPLGDNKSFYEKKFCNAHRKHIGGGRYAWDVTGAADLDLLRQQTANVFFTKKKHECEDLPGKQRLMIPVELSKKDQAAYDKELEKRADEYREKVQRGECKPGAEALVTINQLRSVGSLYKVSAVLERVVELLNQGQQVVVYSEFVDPLTAISEQLPEGVGFEMLTGSVVQAKRQPMMDRFQSGQSKVFLLTKAGGVGITLTAASDVLLFERPWSPADADQLEDRCNRIGQTNKVFTYWFQLGAIDSHIDEFIAGKQRNIDAMRTGEQTIDISVSPQQLAMQILETF